MKKLFITLVLACATLPAMAQWHHHGYGGYRGGYYGGGGWGWVAPAIIGGAVVYAATRPDPVIVQQPPIIVQQPQVQQTGQVIQCPQGTMPFEQHGWVKNQYGQYVQTTYVECK